ncbi:MAG: succinate dehydrogenase assembly factor 2 [Rhizobiales bacterium]|nr:succinate dehydrogenase assembly factor 2 [Hyphomicrobiales bacterium]
MDDLENRRRRAAYRAAHRGTKEMDFLLGRFGAERVSAMAEGELERFEALLELADPELQAWLMGTPAPAGARREPPAEFVGLVAEIRAYHDA